MIETTIYRSALQLALMSLAVPLQGWAGLEWVNASPSGGESFPIHAGGVASATYLAPKIMHCAQSPQGSPLRGRPAPPDASPAATASWRATSCEGLPYPPDAQIAVGEKFVAVSFQTSMAWYDRNGVRHGQLTNFDLFQPLLETLGTAMGRAGAANDCYSLHFLPCARTQSDFRILYDAFRKRFWAIDGAGVYTADWVWDEESTTYIRDPKKARGIIMLAVSQTEDPKDGWYLYWWDAVAHWGKAEDSVYQPGDGADYPCIGVDSLGFYQTNVVGNNKVNRYQHVVLLPAFDGKLISGQTVVGRHYFDLQNPDGQPTINTIVPASHHGWGGDTYFVSRYGATEAIVWGTASPLDPGTMKRARVRLSAFDSAVDAPELGGASKISMSNAGTDVVSAVYRDGQLAFVTNESAPWFNDGDYLSSIRVVRLWVLGGDPAIEQSMFMDHSFGKNAWDDPPDKKMYYGWPAVEMNKDYNLAIVYARSGSSIWPQVRYSAVFSGEHTTRPSRLLKPGENPFDPGGCFSDGKLAACRWGDTAGAAVDPLDDTAIWVAQQYANNANGTDIWVARVF